MIIIFEINIGFEIIFKIENVFNNLNFSYK